MSHVYEGLGRVVVVIPTYNEALNIEAIVGSVLSVVPAVHVLIVDDGSPDGTGALADGLAAHDSRVSVLHRTSKDGLGAAYLAGFELCLAQGFDVICEMDADGSHRAVDLPLILDELARHPETQLVLGSRWVPGGSVQNWPKHREFLSRGGNAYVRILLDLGLKDATGGFRAYRRAALESLDFSSVQSHGYCFQVDMARSIVDGGGQVREVPITFVERVAGESKMSGNIVREALLKVTGWGIAKRAGQVARLFQRK